MTVYCIIIIIIIIIIIDIRKQLRKQTIKRRKANRIGHILRRHCLLKHVIAGMMEGGQKWQDDGEDVVINYWKA